MKNILDFLSARPAFQIAAVDGNNHPRVRLFGFVMEWKGLITFVTNTEKSVYREFAANPYVEISSFNAESVEAETYSFESPLSEVVKP